MNNRYKPRDISAVSFPVTAKNTRNAKNHPSVELGACTPSQLINYAGINTKGILCIIGNHSRGISFLTPMIRRSMKPFLIIGPESDKNSAFMTLQPKWTMDSVQADLPSGSGAIFLSTPYSSYMELCEYFEKWSKKYFIILHLSGGVQVGPELLNLLNATEQCAILCDSVPQGIRNSESRTISAKEFMSQMSYLLVNSAGVATKDLIEILPTYQYEKVSNTMNVNSYTGRAFFHPFRGHKGFGSSVGQTRTIDYKKSLFEMDELQRIFNDGTSLLYDANNNVVFLAQIT